MSDNHLTHHADIGEGRFCWVGLDPLLDPLGFGGTNLNSGCRRSSLTQQ